MFIPDLLHTLDHSLTMRCWRWNFNKN